MADVQIMDFLEEIEDRRRRQREVLEENGSFKNLSLFQKATLGIFCVGTLAVTGFAILGLAEIHNAYRRNYLENQVSIVADINQDGVTSQEEWVRIYRELGKQYVQGSSNPRKDFSNSEFEYFLRRHGRR